MQCLQPRFHLPVPQRAQGSVCTAESTWGREGAPGCSSHSSFSSLEFLIFLSSAANPPSRIYLICSSRWGPAAAHQGTGVRGQGLLLRVGGCSSRYRGQRLLIKVKGCSSRYGGQGLLLKVSSCSSRYRGQGLVLKVQGSEAAHQGTGDRGLLLKIRGLLLKVPGSGGSLSRHRGQGLLPNVRGAAPEGPGGRGLPAQHPQPGEQQGPSCPASAVPDDSPSVGVSVGNNTLLLL